MSGISKPYNYETESGLPYDEEIIEDLNYDNPGSPARVTDHR